MYKYRRVIIGAIAILLVASIVFGLVIAVFGTSSDQIKNQISELEQEAEEIKSKQDALAAEISENESKEMDLVEQKGQIDQQIELIQQEIDNKNEQIREYNLLIAEKQNELDDAVAAKEELDVKYKTRVRAMEETGEVTYWSILFKANSFSDMLDRVNMINEIADADAKMLQQLQEAAIRIETDREELASEKISLEQAKDSLAATNEELEAKRAESDELLNQLISDNDKLREAEEKYEAMEDELTQQIAKKEQEYTQALKEEQQAQNNSSSSGGSSSSGSSGGSSSSGGSTSSYGFIRPVSGGSITCAYGYRIHPITGNYSFHTGVDFGVAQGTPIKAIASGYVTVASYTSVWGYYVTINHGNGFSSLYAHMTNFIVSYGDYVTQGQVIGYVGSTGYSTGPHLHLTLYLNGSHVNPMNYLP